LYEAWRAVAEGGEALDDAQRRVLDNALRDFHLSVVDLEEPARSRFRAIQLELSELESRFGLTGGNIALCWGNNLDGKLGTASPESSSEPVEVAGGHTFAALSAGGRHSCGVTTTGRGYCWGRGFNGELGNRVTNKWVKFVRVDTLQQNQAFLALCRCVVIIIVDNRLFLVVIVLDDRFFFVFVILVGIHCGRSVVVDFFFVIIPVARRYERGQCRTGNAEHRGALQQCTPADATLDDLHHQLVHTPLIDHRSSSSDTTPDRSLRRPECHQQSGQQLPNTDPERQMRGINPAYMVIAETIHRESSTGSQKCFAAPRNPCHMQAPAY
jgi:hypothetical protein